ncbi:MAG: hypothetical protein LCI00_25240 [Chloroflexi bacterium]|nr:hypothetical protein [Chloroflexota bacterium]MCC6895708.1 hypothetical protein [Anaerolineae bacterium]
MNRRFVFVSLMLLTFCVILPVSAQEEAEPDYPFAFPLPAPTETQVEEARACDLDSESSDDKEQSEICDLALEAIGLASTREDQNTPSDKERELLVEIVGKNPAVLLRLAVISPFFNAFEIVAPPDFSDNPITELELTYTFSGLGSTNDYAITITDADTKPVVTGHADVNGSFGEPEDTPTPQPSLAETVDADLIQAFALALDDLIPIQSQFSSAPCWDYYPDWTVKLTFADDTVITLVTNSSNVVGVGGPWQTEIDDTDYMQYSASIQVAISGLFDALDLKFGETAAMGCGGITDPLEDAYPLSGTETP